MSSQYVHILCTHYGNVMNYRNYILKHVKSLCRTFNMRRIFTAFDFRRCMEHIETPLSICTWIRFEFGSLWRMSRKLSKRFSLIRRIAERFDLQRVSRTNETLLNQYRQIAAEQRQKLQDLYSQKRRITWNEMQMQSSYYALSRKFYVDWRNFLR